MSAPLTPTPNPIAQAVLSKTRDLAVLPQVVMKVMELTGRPETSAQAIEDAIRVDPGFTAKMLATANSAFYALPRKVTSIREAAMFMGVKAVRQLAAQVGVYDMFLGKTDKESLRRRNWWRTSIDSAVAGRAVAAAAKIPQAEEAFTCGLLHLIGKTLLDRAASGEYEKVIGLVESGVTSQDAEHAVFGCDHVEVARLAAGKWGFPEVLVLGLDYLNPPSAEEPYGSLRAVVGLSHGIALRRMGQPVETDRMPDDPETWMAKSLGADADALAAFTQRGQEAIAAASAAQAA